MLKCMPPLSPQRAKLFEAIEIASRIAKCGPDAQTVRATVLYCLERNVEGFPVCQMRLVWAVLTIPGQALQQQARLYRLDRRGRSPFRIPLVSISKL
jgi:hypothetical protein